MSTNFNKKSLHVLVVIRILFLSFAMGRAASTGLFHQATRFQGQLMIFYRTCLVSVLAGMT